MGSPFPYEFAGSLFAPLAGAAEHTQWPFGRHVGAPELDHLLAGLGPKAKLEADTVAAGIALVAASPETQLA